MAFCHKSPLCQKSTSCKMTATLCLRRQSTGQFTCIPSAHEAKHISIEGHSVVVLNSNKIRKANSDIGIWKSITMNPNKFCGARRQKILKQQPFQSKLNVKPLLLDVAKKFIQSAASVNPCLLPQPLYQLFNSKAVWGFEGPSRRALLSLWRIPMRKHETMPARISQLNNLSPQYTLYNPRSNYKIRSVYGTHSHSLSFLTWRFIKYHL